MADIPTSTREPSWTVLIRQHGLRCPCLLCDNARRREAATTMLLVYAEALVREVLDAR